MTTKIMLVDDHAIVREGYRALLQRQPQLSIVAEAATARKPIGSIKRVRPISSLWI